MTQAKKIRFLQLFNHLLTLIGIIYVCYTESWYLFEISAIATIVFFIFGINISFHRYITHQSFKTHIIIERILLIIGCLCLVGSPFSWALSHINHHAYADKEGDPYSPHRLSLWKFLMTHFEPIKFQKLNTKRLLKNKNVMFLHEYYFIPIFCYCILLGLINPWLIIFAWAIPSLITLYLLLINNIICHTIGYRNFKTPDETRNNILMSILTFGEGWHNNHHANPTLWKQGIKWWELDPTSWFIRIIKK
jgi:stearoyl-CoA desaturase (delta-9 desaturase)